MEGRRSLQADNVRTIQTALALSLACAAGCATTIRPPADPKDPVVVVLVDYGKHSSLVLPEPAGGSVEYAYGHWGYFALNENDACTGMFALCCYSQGTLGRRMLEVPPERTALRGRIACEELLELKVERAAADLLRAKLKERWERHADTKVANPLNGLTFVKDDECYICWNNCNHVVLRWLEELGCQISGCGCFADFRIVTR
jgi:hypothetical protein